MTFVRKLILDLLTTSLAQAPPSCCSSPSLLFFGHEAVKPYSVAVLGQQASQLVLALGAMALPSPHAQASDPTSVTPLPSIPPNP